MSQAPRTLSRRIVQSPSLAPSRHELAYLTDMSARKLGGGRVLGSGKNLSPALSPLPKQNTLLSPSASSVSLASSASASTPPTDNHDESLLARISVEHSSEAGNAAAAAASSRLVCPICNEEMVGYTVPAEG